MDTRTIRRLFTATVAFTSLFLPDYGISSVSTGDQGAVQGEEVASLQAVPQAAEHTHDLAVVSIKAPKKVTLTTKKPAVVTMVKVTIQNRSAYVETISDQTILANLVNLTVVAQGIGGNCSTPVAAFHTGKPQPVLPVTLKPNKTLNIVFDVTFTCAIDPMKGSGHEDFQYIAQVDASNIDGQEDIDRASDICPRSPIPVVDGSKPDKGCGGKLPSKILGGPVLSDVILKEEGGGSSTKAPLISGLSFSPSAMYVNDGGGQSDIGVTFDFTDPDGNLKSVTIIVLDAGGQTVVSETSAIGHVAGKKSGTILGVITITTSTPGDFTIHLYVTDGRGLQSNTIDSIFRITELPWVTKYPMPTKRHEFSTATVDGLIYVIGGRDATAPITPAPVVSTVEVYDPATDTWSTGPSLPVPIADQMTITCNGKIYAIGGNEEFLATNIVQEFDPETQEWTLKANMPYERASAAVSVNNGLIYISGGEGPGIQLNSLLWYDPVADTWNAGSPMSQSRTGPGGAAIDGQILVYGGYGSTYIPDGGYFKSLESYDPVMDIWSSKADGNPRRDFGVAVFDKLMYVFGGNNVARSLDWVNAYDNAINQWVPKTPMPSSLGFVRAETIGDKIYIFDTNITLEYTPSNDIR